MAIRRTQEELRKDWEDFVPSDNGPSFEQLDFLHNDFNETYLKHRIQINQKLTEAVCIPLEFLGRQS